VRLLSASGKVLRNARGRGALSLALPVQAGTGFCVLRMETEAGTFQDRLALP
jgi:hypothetical protein